MIVWVWVRSMGVRSVVLMVFQRAWFLGSVASRVSTRSDKPCRVAGRMLKRSARADSRASHVDGGRGVIMALVFHVSNMVVHFASCPVRGLRSCVAAPKMIRRCWGWRRSRSRRLIPCLYCSFQHRRGSPS